ncbi:MAG: ATP-binding protein, partial [Halobacteriovoraceae bacterium]|nr:ATP-binding protein [Halobacteriovoraceae bacterium]
AKINQGEENIVINFMPWKILSFIPGRIFGDYVSKDVNRTVFFYLLTVLAAILSCFVYLRIKVKQETTALILEEEREKAIHRSKMATIGEMASGVAHEINNPLAVILGYCEELQLMSEDAKITLKVLKEDLKNISQKLIDHSFRMSKIVKGLKNIARSSESDTMEYYPLKSILDDALGVCQQKIHEGVIKLRQDEIPDSIEIPCRPAEIGQVIINLVSNACDALESLKKNKKIITIGFADYSDKIELSVGDNGEGIPMDIRKKLFAPFFTTKKFGKGTGLGLSISRKIMVAHHGNLSLDGNVKKTKFLIHLPKNLPV